MKTPPERPGHDGVEHSGALLGAGGEDGAWAILVGAKDSPADGGLDYKRNRGEVE
jgi:hypothetical protein